MAAGVRGGRDASGSEGTSQQWRRLGGCWCWPRSWPGSGPMPGGLVPVPANADDLVNASLAAEKDYNQRSNDKYYQVVARVVTAYKQVVAGLMYHLRLELGRTDCRKSSATSQRCNIQNSCLTKVSQERGVLPVRQILP
ncbi:cystatin-like isoform X2 [Narcine bancroftii]|uniref:cystatin-like isoform X2 n=1 Tax=Narcine bancroftii TaxID=1343680 RepID=UPI00383145E6